MLIQNYGLFWTRGQVEWGRKGPGGQGKLQGRNAKVLGKPAVDFRNQAGVYVLYDDTFRIVYVGQTGAGENRLFVRLRFHKTDHLAQRWSKFSWFGIYAVTKKNVLDTVTPDFTSDPIILDHIEAILVAAAEPPLNRQSGRFGDGVERYIQAKAVSAEIDDNE